MTSPFKRLLAAAMESQANEIQEDVTPNSVLGDKLEDAETTNEMNKDVQMVEDLNEIRKALDSDAGLEADSPLIKASLLVFKSKYGIDLEAADDEVVAGEASPSLKERIIKKIQSLVQEFKDWYNVSNEIYHMYNRLAFDAIDKHVKDMTDAGLNAIINRLNKRKTIYVGQDGKLIDLGKLVKDAKTAHVQSLQSANKFVDALIKEVSKVQSEEDVKAALERAASAAKLNSVEFNAPGFDVEFSGKGIVGRYFKTVVNLFKKKEKNHFKATEADLKKFTGSLKGGYTAAFNLLNSAGKAYKDINDKLEKANNDNKDNAMAVMLLIEGSVMLAQTFKFSQAVLKHTLISMNVNLAELWFAMLPYAKFEDTIIKAFTRVARHTNPWIEAAKAI